MGRQKYTPVSFRPLPLYLLAAVLSRQKTAAKNRRQISLHETGVYFCRGNTVMDENLKLDSMVRLYSRQVFCLRCLPVIETEIIS